LPRASVRDLWSTDQAAGILGFIAMAMSLGPMIGPVLGGFVDQWLGWRANFVVFVGLGLAMLWISWADYGETNSEPSETMLKQFRGYPELLRSRRFWAYSLCLMFSIGAFYAYLGAAPMVAQATFGLSAGQVGIAMGTVSAGFMLGNFLSGRYSARVGVVGMMIAGRVAAVAGLAMTLAIFLAGYGNVLILFGGVTFIGLGNGLTLPSANAGVMSVRPRLAGSASGFSGALTVAGGAFWSWATAALLTPENGPRMLLAMALATSALGLAAALWLKRLERLADVSPERAG
jgi:DHA1 family bicyclomycin/chloramphenicol resistance-like MFS transporter